MEAPFGSRKTSTCQDPSGRCVSDGPIEFSSPVYHVYKAFIGETAKGGFSSLVPVEDGAPGINGVKATPYK